ncbi:hypothetical protein ACNPM8_01655 [Glutamicibacter sp. AGC46]
MKSNQQFVQMKSSENGAMAVENRSMYRLVQVWRLRDQLLESTHEIERLPEGPRVVKTEALLLLLARALKPSGEAGSGGSSSGPGLPLDAAALDLQMKIEQEANDQYWIRYPGKPAPGLHDKVIQWVESLSIQHESGSVSVDEEALNECHRVLASWVQEIESLLNPPIIVALRRPCPACHSNEVHEELNGERVVNRAVVAQIRRGKKDTSVLVLCRVCGAEWQGSDIHILEQLTRPA